MFYDYGTDYKSHLPPYYEDIAEAAALDTTIRAQLDCTQACLKVLAESRFVSLANEAGIARWEQILAISSPIKSTLQSRRNAIKAKLTTKSPITIDTLRRVIETYLGVPVDMVLWSMPEVPSWSVFGLKTVKERAQTVWKDYLPTGTPYTIDVYYKGFEKLPDLQPLYVMIYELVPAHILVRLHYKYATWQEAQTEHPTWQDMNVKTWDYIKLGAWLNA